MNNKKGLIFGYVLDGKGGGSEIDWEKLGQWTPDQGTLWIHFDFTSEDVQKWLHTESNLSQISCELLLAEDIAIRHSTGV